MIRAEIIVIHFCTCLLFDISSLVSGQNEVADSKPLWIRLLKIKKYNTEVVISLFINMNRKL